MKNLFLVLIFVLALFISSCSVDTVENNDLNLDSVKEENKPFILTTFYPIQEITEALVKDSFDVKVLIGPGVEPHSFEPSPIQIAESSKADVFITMGGLFEHVEEDIIQANLEIKVIDSTHNVELVGGDDKHDSDEHENEVHKEEHSDEEEHEELHEGESHDEHDHGEFDPHIWLSIHNMEIMTREIQEKLTELYPDNKDFFEANANSYLEKLEELENEFSTKLTSCEHKEIIVNHKAFGYLSKEYGFEQISIAGFSPESEPTPKTIQNVVSEAREHNLKYVFSEGQLDKKVAKTIANDIGGDVLELNPIKLNSEENYFSIMRGNLDSLVLGLNCQN